MNIAFDATAILGSMSKNRGIGNYALNQFRAMVAADTENHYFFFNMIEEFSLGVGEDLKDRIEEDYLYSGEGQFLLTKEKYKDVFREILRNYLEEHKIDVFYVTSPFESNCYCYERKWFGDVQVVATVYDIIPYVFKDIYLKSQSMLDWYMSRVNSLKQMDKCLVISPSVKTDMVKYLQFDESKIDVIWGAVDARYKKIDIAPGTRKQIFHKFGIHGSYIMCTGGDDIRKNIKSLIQAYAKLDQSLISRYQLVIVCKLSKEAVERYTSLANQLKIAGRLVLTNFVTDEELLQLYNMASLMAFPSQYEGFGLPVVEAFACGIPVLTSNNSSLVEIAGDAAVLVDPFSEEDIIRGLREALTTTDLEALVSRGSERLKLFEWDRIARLTIDFIQNMEIKTQPQESLAEKTDNTKRQKIAYFTPLPPIPSGISDYSVDILSELQKYVDIDVFIDDYKAECELPLGVNIYNYKEFQPEKYQEIMYHMGNSQYHIYMYDIIRKNPGTIVLHDYNLHDVLQYYTLHLKKDMNLYKNYLLEDLDGSFVEDYVTKLQQGMVSPQNYDFEVNGFVTNYAKKIIVHSEDIKEKLLMKNISCDVAVIRSYAKIEPLADPKAMRAQYGYGEDDVIFASFGYVQETKRAIPCLKAFAKAAQEHEHARLLYVGKMDTGIEDEFSAIVKQYGLEDKVKVTGYTSLSDFVQYIDLTDVCLNLRYPYHGETSGSLMRILGKGKCVAVNRIGSFNEVPDGVVLKLPDAAAMNREEEIEKLSGLMKNLLADPELRQQYGTAARKYAEEYLDLRMIAKQYDDQLSQAARQNALSERLLGELAQQEILTGNYSTDQLKSLAHTLSKAMA